MKNSIKNSSFGDTARLLARPYFWYKYQRSDFEAWIRKMGLIESSKYSWIKKVKDSHLGERCFVVATGPSLTIEDLELIKDEYGFGMNSCVLALEKTGWVPSFFAMEDEFVYNKVENVLLEEAKNRLKDKVVVSNVVASICTSARRFKQFPHHYLDHKYNPKETGEIRFSEDCYVTVYDGFSIIFSILQFAVYMGFKEIYLLGCDCNYNQAKKNFIEHGAKDPNASIMGDRLIYTHSMFDKFAKAHGVQVYNCTRGGMLEVYPRKKLEDVLIDKHNKL